jgi:hypothetical protein
MQYHEMKEKRERMKDEVSLRRLPFTLHHLLVTPSPFAQGRLLIFLASSWLAYVIRFAAVVTEEANMSF